MKRNLRTVLSIVLALMFVSAICAPVFAAGAGQQQAGELQTWSGRVTSEGDFMTTDGQQYALEGAQADQLQQHEGQNVEIRGTVTEKDGKQAINVESYRLMDQQQ